MNLYKILALSLVIAFSFSGCGGNNSDTPLVDNNESIIITPEGNITTVVLPVKSTVLTTNKQIVTIDVRVYDGANNPYSDGEVKLITPSDVLQGRDVGAFDKSFSSLTNGVAVFTYTAPDDLKADTSPLSFGFYHDPDSSSVATYTMSIEPETNQTIISSYKLISSNGSDVKIALESTKSVSYSIYDSNGIKLKDSDVKSITVASLNPGLIKLSDSSGNGGLDKLTQLDKNPITVYINSNKLSGLVPLKVDAKFIDANGEEQNLTKVYSFVVLSGPPTAFSLSYAGTTQDETYAKFIEHWVLTATDKYNNRINTNPTISTGMLAGYAQSSAATQTNAGNYLFFPTASGGSIAKNTPDEFHAQSNVFDNVDYVHDYLVTYGNGYTYDASGKWDIQESGSNVVTLIDDYIGEDVSRLGFAVGNNYRQDTCRDGEKWLGNVYPQNENYILDSHGSVILDVEYDYYLVGKDVMLWVNLLASTNNKMTRAGEARKVTLRGLGLTGESKNFSKGYSGIIHLKVNIANTIEYYRNANFAADIEISADDVNWTISGSSMNNGIKSCIYDGVAYVDVNITDPAGSAGTVSLTNVLITDEF